MSDQARQLTVTATVPCQNDQPRPILQVYFTADDQLQRQAVRTDLAMGTHHARQRALVGDCQCSIAQRSRLLYELLWMRGATLEAEIAQAV
ncbi:hypothetical protein SDC9_181427 [bioreactor metagenome]|uniref:Uncharacterized protein n=1 Tax=bioreactor metagenome TaxID=1076179 RepID=A0A645H4K3_9ZZZZ